MGLSSKNVIAARFISTYAFNCSGVMATVRFVYSLSGRSRQSAFNTLVENSRSIAVSSSNR